MGNVNGTYYIEEEMEKLVNDECKKKFGEDVSKWTLDQHNKRKEMINQTKHIIETEFARNRMGQR